IEAVTNGDLFIAGYYAQTADFDPDESVNNTRTIQALYDGYVLLLSPNPEGRLDTDGDGLPDVYEQANGMNHLDSSDATISFDTDTLTNWEEYSLGTDMRNSDSDGDLISDDFEFHNPLLNPLDLADGLLDFDHDGISNGAEFAASTDMFVGSINKQFDSINELKGSGYVYTTQIEVDALGNQVIAGFHTKVTDMDPTPNISNRTANSSVTDSFVTKWDASGNLLWHWGNTPTSAFARVEGMVLDSLGNIYITGYFSGMIDFDNTAGVDSRSSNGSYDAFITKLASDGTYQWTKSFGGSSPDYGYDLGIDANDQLYVAGQFLSTSLDFDPDQSGAGSATLSGSSGAFVVKLDHVTGAYRGHWTWLNGGNLAGTSVGIDSNNRVYVGGYHSSGSFDVGGTTFNNPTVYKDVFAIALQQDIDVNDQSNFIPLWAYSPHNGNYYHDEVTTLEVDSTQGKVYLGGSFQNHMDFDSAGAEPQVLAGGSDDGFLVQLDATTGAYGWHYQIVGNKSDIVRRISLDGSGAVYVVGDFASTNVNFSPFGTDIKSNSGNYTDVFITRLYTDGAYGWTQSYGGGSGGEYVQDIEAVTNGDLFIAGYYAQTADFDPDESVNNTRTIQALYDGYVLILTSKP
ncbi:MAG: hypothetical protein OEY38_20535, partial [Gammaproteobacteria bacterium]|nr:hypothetical protein [Gammaproteobacteria bacterium]